MFDWHLAPGPRRPGAAGVRAEDLEAVRAFYAPTWPAQATPLAGLPGLAARLGLGALHVKDESARFGLNAFKITGVRFAVDRLLAGRRADGLELCAVTTGNHGRAVARVAAEAGLPAHIVVPAGTAAARLEALRGEGADVIVHDGSYDDAVVALTRMAPSRGWTIVSDTSWPGYDDVPRDIMAGYTLIIDEARRQWPAPPDVVIVQGGVGGLAAAVTGWLALTFGAARPFTIVCEPSGAACLLASARAGRRTCLTTVGETHMAGLRCADPSPAAWGTIAGAADAFVSIPDAYAEDAMRRLARPVAGDPSIESGSSGACGVGALFAILREPALAPVRDAAGLGSATSVLAFITEGATDPAVFARAVGPAAGAG